MKYSFLKRGILKFVLTIALYFGATAQVANVGSYGLCFYDLGNYGSGETCSVLALKEINLEAKFDRNNKPILSYEITANKNIDKVEIYVSYDAAQNFVLLDTDTNFKNDKEKETTFFRHQNYTKQQKQVLFYRVKAFDKQSKFIFSNIAKLSQANEGNSISVFPNPVVSQLNISFKDGWIGKTIQCKLIDEHTKLVFEKTMLNVSALEKIQVQNFTSGNYWLILNFDNDTKAFPVQIIH
jgi:hypothetical protein